MTARGRPAGVALLILGGLGLLLLAWPRRQPTAATGAWMARAGVRPVFAEVAGHRVRYVRKGAGPPVVLVHGMASSIYTWADVLPALAERHDVVALDLPGFGESQIPGRPGGGELLRVLAALVDRLGLERSHLVGNSLGGALAAAFAAQQPLRVERLVLIDSAGFNFARQGRPFLLRLLSRVPPALSERLARCALVERGLRQVFHDPARITPERIAEYCAPFARPGAVRALHGLLQAGDELAFPELLGRIQAPTLVIWGRQDRWIPVGDAERFVAAIPNARQVVIEDCGHVPQEERPADVVRMLREFLDGE